MGIAADLERMADKVLAERDALLDASPLWPVKSTDTSRGNQYSPNHPARDVVGSAGDPIVSSVGGRIVGPVIRDADYGLNVSVLAESGPFAGYVFHYSHLSGIAKNLVLGARVKAGEYLGMVGSTGRSTGPHLDFEVYSPSGARIDPLEVEWGNFAPPSTVPKLSDNVFSEGSSVGEDRPVTEPRSLPGKVLDAVNKAVPGWETGEEQQAAGVPEGIIILRTPLGEIAIPQPAALFKRAAVFSVAALVFIVVLGVIVARSGPARKARKVGRAVAKESVGAAVGLVPGGSVVVGGAKITKAVVG